MMWERKHQFVAYGLIAVSLTVFVIFSLKTDRPKTITWPEVQAREEAHVREMAIQLTTLRRGDFVVYKTGHFSKFEQHVRMMIQLRSADNEPSKTVFNEAVARGALRIVRMYNSDGSDNPEWLELVKEYMNVSADSNATVGGR